MTDPTALDPPASSSPTTTRPALAIIPAVRPPKRATTTTDDDDDLPLSSPFTSASAKRPSVHSLAAHPSPLRFPRDDPPHTDLGDNPTAILPVPARTLAAPTDTPTAAAVTMTALLNDTDCSQGGPWAPPLPPPLAAVPPTNYDTAAHDSPPETLSVAAIEAATSDPTTTLSPLESPLISSEFRLLSTAPLAETRTPQPCSATSIVSPSTHSDPHSLLTATPPISEILPSTALLNSYVPLSEPAPTTEAAPTDIPLSNLLAGVSSDEPSSTSATSDLGDSEPSSAAMGIPLSTSAVMATLRSSKPALPISTLDSPHTSLESLDYLPQIEIIPNPSVINSIACALPSLPSVQSTTIATTLSPPPSSSPPPLQSPTAEPVASSDPPAAGLSPSQLLSEPTIPVQGTTTERRSSRIALRSSNRLASVKSNAISGATVPKTMVATTTVTPSGRLAKARAQKSQEGASPSAKGLAGLTAAEVRKITASNTLFNEKSNQCPLELVVVCKDIPRPVSPPLGASELEDDATIDELGLDDNDNDDDGWEDIGAVDEPETGVTDHTDAATGEIVDGEAMEVDDDETSPTIPANDLTPPHSNGSPTVGAGTSDSPAPTLSVDHRRRIRWNPKLTVFAETNTDEEVPDAPTTTFPPLKSCLKNPVTPAESPRISNLHPTQTQTQTQVQAPPLALASSTSSDPLLAISPEFVVPPSLGDGSCSSSNISLDSSIPPVVQIQRFVYTDDDLNDPEFIDQLIYRNRVYARTAPSANGEFPIPVPTPVSAGDPMGSSDTTVNAQLAHFILDAASSIVNNNSLSGAKPSKRKKRRR
ncbi:hypothetical protein H4R33_006333 [Dimargaris cristalligena]|nr:hypothetical protein H4R33_006333 [Dimargaris cristalligena]